MDPIHPEHTFASSNRPRNGARQLHGEFVERGAPAFSRRREPARVPQAVRHLLREPAVDPGGSCELTRVERRRQARREQGEGVGKARDGHRALDARE